MKKEKNPYREAWQEFLSAWDAYDQNSSLEKERFLWVKIEEILTKARQFLSMEESN